jgi:hypothetical protein
MHHGIYINLDRDTARREALIAGLEHAGLSPGRYCRFAAIEPAADAPELSRGLRTRGELGIWRSLLASFDQVSTGDFAGVVHVMEDDVVHAPGAAAAIAAISAAMRDHPALADVDIVFLDYFIGRDLFAHIMSSDAAGHAGGEGRGPRFMNAASAYQACTSSFLLRRSSAAGLARALRQMLESPGPLVPVDLALRALLRAGRVKGLLTVPPLAAPSWEQDAATSVQTGLDDRVRQKQRAHVLLRLLAAGIETPAQCADRLAELSGVDHGLTSEATAQEFLALFDTIKFGNARF